MAINNHKNKQSQLINQLIIKLIETIIRKILDIWCIEAITKFKLLINAKIPNKICIIIKANK